MVFPDNIEQKIGFLEIRKLLKGHCISRLAVDRIEAMTMQTDVNVLRSLLQQTAEMARLLEEEIQLPGEDFFDLRPYVRKLRVEGLYLEEQELWELKRSLDTLHSWIELIRPEDDEEGERHPYPALEKMAEGVFTFRKVCQRIEQVLDKYGHVKDSASPELARLRNDLRHSEGTISRTLVSILDSAKRGGLIEHNVMPTMRDGRLVIPVSPALKKRIPGIIHDESQTGKTVFVEPTAVVEANNHIRELEAEEKREVIRILQALTNELRPNEPEFGRATEFLADIEFTLAKHRLQSQMQAVVPSMQAYPMLDWTMARHPLLETSLRRQGKRIVPLEIELTRKQRILIISGPNAGGKSVCLKTVALLQYMLQCGLPIPVGENSRAGIFRDIFIDIGDQQSITDDLSTYSGHLLCMKTMMRHAGEESLLLVDEMGSGTEPRMGGAIAEAIMGRFVQSGAFGVITTHYQNLKQFGEDHQGVVNGAMLYDRQKMEPLFQLQVGNPGSSFAVEIARKMGIPQDVIDEAARIVGKDYVSADKYLLDIARDKRYWENKRQNIHNREKDMERTIQQYEEQISELKQKRKAILADATEEAQRLIKESNARIESTIKEIKEAQAEKERTLEARRDLQEYRTSLEEEKERKRVEAQRKSDEADRKMRQIERRQQRREQRKGEALAGLTQALANRQQATKPAPAVKPIRVGDTVRIKGQIMVGTVREVVGSKATVLFGLMRTIVDTKRLEHATMPKEKERPLMGTASILNVSNRTQEHIHETQKNFTSEIDVRGMRVQEALETITHYVDDATLVGASQVRILHGTGTGALRQALREYLATVPQVRSAHDEHVQFGGAGITVVQFG